MPDDTHSNPSPFALSRDEMRRIGYLVIDRIVERFDTIRDERAVTIGDPAALATALDEPLPERGAPLDEILRAVDAHVFANMVNLMHPRFFAFISSPNNYVSAMADALTSGYNPFVGTWLGGSGPTALELVVIDWLREVCGLPAGAGGLFVSGGSMANLTGIAAGRHAVLAGRPDGAVFVSDQAHASNDRALRVLGFDGDSVHTVSCDDRHRMDVSALESAVATARREGQTPFCVIATAGTTNIGAVDPLGAIADVCAAHGMWLHVDGAYGAAAMFSRTHRDSLSGIERADSLSLDPHKWMFQPFELGCVLVRDRAILEDAFRMTPHYMREVHRLDALNLGDHGVQLTRSFRALKLWMSIKFYGAAAFRDAIDHGIALAEYAERFLRDRPGWEVVTPAQLAVVSFRRTDPGWSDEETDRRNDALVPALAADGFAMLSSTVLDGRTALRLCTINPSTRAEDIDDTIARLEYLADSYSD